MIQINIIPKNLQPDETRSVAYVNKAHLVWLMFQVLSNQHYQHHTNQNLRSWANTVFQKSCGLRASVSFFPLPLSIISFFCLRPNFSRRTRAETLASRLLLTGQRRLISLDLGICLKNTFSLFPFSSLCLDITKLWPSKSYFWHTESYIIEGYFALAVISCVLFCYEVSGRQKGGNFWVMDCVLTSPPSVNTCGHRWAEEPEKWTASCKCHICRTCLIKRQLCRLHLMLRGIKVEC